MGRMVPKLKKLQRSPVRTGVLGRHPRLPSLPRAPSLSLEDAQDPWAEEALDSSFLGSGEELDLLSEILDSLSMGASRTGGLRPSQSLDCCHRRDPDSCFSLVRAPQSSPSSPSFFPAPPASEGQQLAHLPTPIQPDIPGTSRWRPDEEKPPEPQPLSLPADLPSLQTLQPLDAMTSSKDPISQPHLEASQISFSSQSSSASADPSSQGDPEPHRLILHLSPSPKAAKDPRAQESPCAQLSTAPTHSSPLESPQLLVPTKPNLDITWTSQPLDSSSDPGSPENPRSQPSEVPQAEHAHLQLPEGPGALRSPAAPANWQEPQAWSRPRVAELKKCFEG